MLTAAKPKTCTLGTTDTTMTTKLTHHHLCAEQVNDDHGTAILLTQQDGIEEPHSILVHPFQLRAVCERFGIIASDPQGAKTIATLQRRMGEMLAESELQKGGRPAEKPVETNDRFLKLLLKQGPALVSNEDGKSAPKLVDAGISYDVSSRAQKLAAVPEAEFEAELAAAQASSL